MTVAAPLEARVLAPSSRLQAEHTAAYLNFLSRLPPRLSPSVVPFGEEKKRKRGPFRHYDDGDDEERRCSSSSCSSSSTSKTFEAPLLPPPLPRHRGKATLVLDLDHTLVRSVALPAGREPGSGFEVCDGPGGALSTTKTAFARRPHLGAFLSKVTGLFEVVAFTAGSRAYAEPVLDAIDPKGVHFAWRVYREGCVRVPVPAATASTAGERSSTSVYVVKDLRRLGRPLSRTLLVDNSPTCFAYQVSNGVPIPSWKGGGGSPSGESEDDTALLDLLPLLERAASAEDVRPLVEASFPAAAAAVAAARAHPSLFACFDAAGDDGELRAEAERKRSAFAAACEAADKAAEEEEARAAAGDASSDESDATGLATTTAPLDLLLGAATTTTSGGGTTDDDDKGASAAVSSPLLKGKKRARRCVDDGRLRAAAETAAAAVAVC